MEKAAGANPRGELQEDELAGSSVDLETLESLISLADEIEYWYLWNPR